MYALVLPLNSRRLAEYTICVHLVDNLQEAFW